MTEQNFKNHSRLVPMFHYVAFTLLLVILIGSVINLVNTMHQDKGDIHFSALLIFLLTLLVSLALFFGRSFALKAQDRAIRAEENLRYFIATGKPFDSRLNIRQIIALRFAGDNEFVALAKKAVDENLSSKNIKQSITNWKADNNRV